MNQGNENMVNNNIQEPTNMYQQNQSFDNNNNNGGKNNRIIIIGIIILLLIVLVVIMCFFVLKPVDKGSNNGGGSKDTTEKDNSKKTKVELPGEYHIPLKEIYFSVPKWHETELGYTERFTVYDSKYVAITGNKHLTASSSKEAYEVCSKDFIEALSKTSAKEFKIEKDEEVKINGIKMYKFEGKLIHELGNTRDLYTIGYSFVIDGVALQITGVVMDEAQPEELIEEMRDTVNEMAKHVRTTEEE